MRKSSYSGCNDCDWTSPAVKRLIDFPWPFTAYRDVNRGSMLERAAAVRNNQRLSRSLPLYSNRWAISAFVELMLTQVGPTLTVPLFGCLFAISFSLLIDLIQVYMRFKLLK